MDPMGNDVYIICKDYASGIFQILRLSLGPGIGEVVLQGATHNRDEGWDPPDQPKKSWNKQERPKLARHIIYYIIYIYMISSIVRT